MKYLKLFSTVIILGYLITLPTTTFSTDDLTTRATQIPDGTVPLKLYYNRGRGDNFTTASVEGGQDALKAGYGFARIEGFIFPTRQPGTVPLKLYYHNGRGDNFTTATAEGEQDALKAGYGLARIEGYVYRTRRPGTVPLKLFYHNGREDNFTTATAEGEQDALKAGYGLARIEGYVYPPAQIIDEP